nr:immunoglobulin heavy chain junction region [Mus musculus]
CARSEEYFDYW